MRVSGLVRLYSAMPANRAVDLARVRSALDQVRLVLEQHASGIRAFRMTDVSCIAGGFVLQEARIVSPADAAACFTSSSVVSCRCLCPTTIPRYVDGRSPAARLQMSVR